jgi:hypothetical protein
LFLFGGNPWPEKERPRWKRVMRRCLNVVTDEDTELI